MFKFKLNASSYFQISEINLCHCIIYLFMFILIFFFLGKILFILKYAFLFIILYYIAPAANYYSMTSFICAKLYIIFVLGTFSFVLFK